MDYGYRFSEFLMDTEHHITTLKLIEVKKRCPLFMKKLLEEFVQRIPPNYEITLKVQYFSPKLCIEPTLRIPHSMLPWAILPTDAGFCPEKIENQWNQLQNLQMIFLVKREINNALDITDFWITVGGLTNALGEKKFDELANFTLVALSLSLIHISEPTRPY